jgi:hypothetical protein
VIHRPRQQGSWQTKPLLASEIGLFRCAARPNVGGMKTFGQVLEWADELPLEEQESLVSILQRRLREQRRAELVQAVKEARKEFRAGRCRPASPAGIMKKILA